MALNVDVPIVDDAIDDGEITVKNEYAFAGFNIIEKDETHHPIDGVEFYFYIAEPNDNTFLIKTMFAFEEKNKNTDLEFLDSPLHNMINLNKLAKNDNGKELSKLLLDIADEDQYYCSFKAIDISDNCDTITCIGVHRDAEDKQHKLTVKLPFTVYCRIQILKNQMIYNVPLNLFMDQDSAFLQPILHRNCYTSYLGCDTSYKSQVLAFFSLRDTVNNTLGIIAPVLSLNKIVTSNILPKEKFIELYTKSAIINMTKIFIIDWIENKKAVKKVCIYLRCEDSVDIYMLKDDIKECKLMKPYELVYGK